MDVQFLKDKLLEENRIVDMLTELCCHHIKQSDNMIQCANPDGDNATAICIYLNENLTTINYTRTMLPSGQTRTTDFIDLVSFIRNCSFFQSLQWICNVCGYDYYEDEPELPRNIRILYDIIEMTNKDKAEIEDKTPIKPIDPHILTYYLPVGNKMWEDDGISLSTQQEFSVMYDPQSNRIILPYFDTLGSLVGIKGRLMKEHIEEWEQKYIYMTRFNKSKYVFGLDKTMDMIARQGFCPIFEGEKSVMIAYEHNIGSVAVCGSKISKYQANLLTRLNVPLFICFDKDKTEEDVKKEAEKFMDPIPIYYMLDTDNILKEKEAPVDRWENWERLIATNVYKYNSTK
jgi:DNA primase